MGHLRTKCPFKQICVDILLGQDEELIRFWGIDLIFMVKTGL